jgi:hypothetical protein
MSEGQPVNLLLLVEGDTEARLYESWLRHRAPWLKRVSLVADLQHASYVLVNGKGYPQFLRNIDALLQDIQDYPGRVGEFWICADAEEVAYEAQYQYLVEILERLCANLHVRPSNPGLTLRVIVQNCCIETWLLGNAGFLRQGPQGRDLVDFKRFFDVSTQDPEAMGTLQGYLTRASFHEAYLKAMFRERGHNYSKQHPAVAREGNYLDALEQRFRTTPHLRSMSELFAGLAALTSPLPSRPHL